MNNLIYVEKAFDKIQYPVEINMLHKLGLQWN